MWPIGTKLRGELKEETQPSVLIGSSNRWSLAARLAMAMERHGCAASAICPEGHPLRYTNGVKKIYTYSAFDSLGSLKAAILDARPTIILPCDDQVVLQLHALYAKEPGLRKLIEFSIGHADSYAILESRGQLLEAAAEIGIRTPLNRTVESAEQLADWPETSFVLKRDGSLGGSGVSIAHNQEEAAAAYKKLIRPMTVLSAVKHSLVNRDPLAFWLWGRRVRRVITQQQYIPGRPANTMVVCSQGEVLASVTVEVLRTAGATGAATVVRLLRNEEIEKASRSLAYKLKLSGFHGMDFILARGGLNQPRGAAYLIELNPRCTQLGHLRLPGQGDLAGVLSAMLFASLHSPQSLPSLTEDVIAGDTIAFFPQAILSNPLNPYVWSGYHDVPWEQPQLVRELLQEIWPNRKWTARLYHYFCPTEPVKEVQYEDAL